MWEPAVSGMEKAHNRADLSYRRIRRYLVWRLKRLEACDFSHVRVTGYYNDLKALLNHMIEKGLSSKERQEGIYFVENLEDIKRILRFV